MVGSGGRDFGPIYPFIALVIAILAAAAAYGSATPPSPRAGMTGDGQFSADRAMETLRILLDDETPHPAGSPANFAVRERLKSGFEDVGVTLEERSDVACRASIRASQVSCAPVFNLFGQITKGDGPAVILMAHHDSVGAGPGAADDMHAAAIIIEIAAILRSESPRANPVYALVTDAEEDGLFGARAFFSKLDAAPEIGAVINMEARGNSGMSLLFETGEGSDRLIRAYAATARRPAANSVMQVIYKTLPNDTDFSETLAAGVTGVNFAFIGNVAHYHTPLDSLANLDRRSVQHQGDNALGMTRALAAADFSAPPGGEGVYADLWSRVLVNAPASWAAPLALLGTTLLAGAGALWARGRRRRIVAAGASVVLLPMILVAACLCARAAAGLAGLFGSPAPGFAHPEPLRIAIWLAAGLAIVRPGVLLARWLGPHLTLFSIWGWIAALAVLSAILAPGASINFLIPLLPAALVLLIAAVVDARSGERSTGSRAFRIAAFIAAVWNLAWWIPLIRLFEDSLGLDPPYLQAVFVATALAGFAPLLAFRSGEDRIGAAAASTPASGWRRHLPPLLLPAAVFAGMVVASIAAGLAPAFSPFRPQPVNVLHVTDALTNEAQWRVAARPLTLPAELRAAAEFSMMPEPRQPGLLPAGFVAPATAASLGATGPAVETLLDEREGAERTLRLAFPGLADAGSFRLLIPEDARPLSITIAGETLAFDSERAVGGVHMLQCFGRVCDGVDIRLNAAPSDPTDEGPPLGAPEEAQAPSPWLIAASRRGLPPGGDVLVRARPATATRYQNGDESIVIHAYTPPP
ncbi:M28 family peptidase [bacterium]|nr:M28 family peptidase [bacterium]